MSALASTQLPHELDSSNTHFYSAVTSPLEAAILWEKYGSLRCIDAYVAPAKHVPIHILLAHRRGLGVRSLSAVGGLRSLPEAPSGPGLGFIHGHVRAVGCLRLVVDQDKSQSP